MYIRNILKLSGSWHFHQKQTIFSTERPTGPILSSSQSVCLVAEEVFHVPSQCLFLGLSLALRSQDNLKAPSTVNEVGPSSSSLAVWTHIKAASTVKWAHHLFLLKHSKVGLSSSSFEAQWSGPIIFFSCWMATFEGCILQTPPPQMIIVAIKIFFFVPCYFPHRFRVSVSTLRKIYREIFKFSSYLHGCINIF